MVIFDNDLSPSQMRVLTEELGVQVLDRSGLILDIFAQRAKTKEGRLQVELAQYQYLLPRLTGMWTHLERQAGTSGKGSITGIYTVLVDGDDMNEPIADAVRSILDGHIVLSRAIAAQNHFPAIDVLASVSRVMTDVVTKEHREAAQRMRALMAVYKEAEDLIHIGAYVKGSSKKIDEAIQKIDAINDFLCQGVFDVTSFEETQKTLEGI